MQAVSEATPQRPFTARVLEEIMSAMGLDELGHAYLNLDAEAGVLRRWGSDFPPRNGALSLTRFDQEVRFRLDKLMEAA